MAPIANDVQAVSLASARLADASAVFATDAYDAYDGDGIFDDDIQPLVKLALGMQDSTFSDNVFGFMHKKKLRTGYNDKNKTLMLIDLMFTNDDA
jgi:hypothetical protein